MHTTKTKWCDLIIHTKKEALVIIRVDYDETFF